MALRGVSRRRNYESLARGTWSSAITRVSLQDAQGQKIVEVDLQGGLSVLAGGNGAGKSSMLRLLAASLGVKGDWDRSLMPAVPSEVKTIVVSGVSSGEDWRASYALDEGVCRGR